MKRVSILLLSVILLSLIGLSCSSSTQSTSQQTSGIAYRAFVSNSVSAGTTAAGVYIINAQTDVRPILAPISAGANPGMMVVTPNLAQTLVFSGIGTGFSDNTFSIINNASEQNAARATLPGATESFVASPDSSTAYIAVPTAPIVGQSPGVIAVVALSSGTETALISCPPGNPVPAVCVAAPPVAPVPPVPQGFNPPYRYLSIGNTGNRVLAFSSGSDEVANVVAVVTPSSVGTANPVITFVPGFDHPVSAYFNSDDTMAYIVNCGPECGGQQASVQTLDLTASTLTAGPSYPVPAATVALVVNSTMYLAGTPLANPDPQPCDGQVTAAVSCGLLTIFDLNTLSVVNSAPIIITDGYHTKLALGANGQLFIGAKKCTEIAPPLGAPPGGEVRGCLSIYNTLDTPVGDAAPGTAIVPPASGDATGIQPIGKRTVVYVIQGGSIYIYDATTDALQTLQIQNIVGQFIDVKIVNF